MASSTAERSEEATPRRREEARRKGQLATSRDLAAACSIGAAAATIAIELPWATRRLADAVAGSIARALETPGDASILVANVRCAFELLLTLSAPPLAAALAVGCAVAVLQTGGALSAAPLAPDLKRLSPAAGLKRL